MLPQVTVAVGNREECEVAVGETEPRAGGRRAAGRRRRAGRGQAGPEGRAGQDPRRAARGEPADADHAAERPGRRRLLRRVLCHGLLAGWPLEKVLPDANAAGAIVASRLECSTAMPTEAEIETLLAGGDPNAGLTTAPAPCTSRARR